MKKIFTVLALSVLSITMLTGCVSNKKYKELDLKYAEKITEDKEKDATIKDYSKQINSLTCDNEALSTEVERLKEEIARLRGDDKTSSSSDNSSNNSSSNNSSSSSSSNSSSNQRPAANVTYTADYSQNDIYLTIKFWRDGSTYMSSNTTWYYDRACTRKVPDNISVQVVSPTIDSLKLENGNTVYSCMTGKGLVYSSSTPSLKIPKELPTNVTLYEADASQNSSYLQAKFYLDGNGYTDSKATWYFDHNSTQKINDSSSIIVVSPVVETVKLSNGYTVYSCMTSTGLVWSTSKPYLKQIN